MTLDLEISQCSLSDWERAILMGYEVWRQAEKNLGGRIFVDMNAGFINYQAK